MLLLYNFGIFLYRLLLILVSPFNSKAKSFLQGRVRLLETVQQKITFPEQCIWFHFASLGEFEQGRPVLEKLKETHPGERIVISFFSPSGYEIRKNYHLADVVCYLPLDTAANAKAFVRLIRPKAAVFTKYEFWYHHFEALRENGVPLLLISGIFRPEQVFFKWYGGFYRKILGLVTHFFVQNEQSAALLKGLGLTNVSLSGDTRFDRVAQHAGSATAIPLIEDFCAGLPVCIAGSTWPQDESLLERLIQQFPGWKFILAPHEVSPAHLRRLREMFPESLFYSKIKNKEAQGHRVLVIDQIGLLSSIYRYGNLAYIGGGFGAGIHNTLEAAAFGLPVIFGPKYQKFQEAKDLLMRRAAISIDSAESLSAAFLTLQKDTEAGNAARQYVASKTGATTQIVHYLERYL